MKLFLNCKDGTIYELEPQDQLSPIEEGLVILRLNEKLFIFEDSGGKSRDGDFWVSYHEVPLLDINIQLGSA